MIVKWTMLLLLAVMGSEVGGQTGQEGKTECRKRVDTQCGAAFIDVLNTNRNDVPVVCKAADVMLGCAADVIATCDVMEAAHVIEIVLKGQIIELYKPNGRVGCTSLDNAKLPVYLSDDQCSKGLSQCLELLMIAEALPPTPPPPSTPLSPLPAADTTGGVDAITACLLFEGFKDCTQAELSECSGDVMSTVNDKLQRADISYHAQFQCHDRTGEIRFEECLNPLFSQRNRVSRDEMCRLYEESALCVEGAKSLGMVELTPAFLDQEFKSVSSFVFDEPYFCQSENPCLATILKCNKTTNERFPLQRPCQLLETYDSCLVEAIPECEKKFRQDTFTAVQNFTVQVNQRFACESGSSTPSPSSQFDKCNDIAAKCSDTFSDQLDSSGNDNALVCQAVDSLLICVINGSDVCDHVSKADLLGAMKPVVTAYSDPASTGCALKNAGHPALQLDDCSEAIVDCNTLLFSADSTLDDLFLACRRFTDYEKCTRERLSVCDVTTREKMAGHVQSARNKFAEPPFICPQRANFDSLSASSKFPICQTDFMATLDASDNFDISCKARDKFEACVTDAKRSASNDQVSQFQSAFTEITHYLTQPPFFCDTENPCEERFKMCRRELSVGLQQGCDVLDVLVTCEQQVQAQCSSTQQLSQIGELVRTEMHRIESRFQCNDQSFKKATPTTPPPPAPTPTSTTTTTAIVKPPPSPPPANQLEESNPTLDGQTSENVDDNNRQNAKAGSSLGQGSSTSRHRSLFGCLFACILSCAVLLA